MKQINDLYIITTHSNMHVGSGDVNFGVIDNLIQRDVLNNYPNINSSGLKGAVREFFKHYYGGEGYSDADKLKEKEKAMYHIFGSSPKAKQEDMKSGTFRFFEANMLSIPVRSDKETYFMATCQHIVRELKSKIENFNIPTDATLVGVLDTLLHLKVNKSSPFVFNSQYSDALIEDTEFKAIYTNLSDDELVLLEKTFGSPLVLLHDSDFGCICKDNYLPVIARNNLEDGRSQNLWYEQVLPRATRLYFVLMKDEKYGPKLDQLFARQMLQIGGNASIGYGFTKVKSLSGILKK